MRRRLLPVSVFGVLGLALLFATVSVAAATARPPIGRADETPSAGMHVVALDKNGADPARLPRISSVTVSDINDRARSSGT